MSVKVAGLRIWTGKSRHKQNTGWPVRAQCAPGRKGAGHGVPQSAVEAPGEGHSGGDLGGSPTTPGLALTFTSATLACRVTSGKSPSHLDTGLLQLKLKPKLANRAPKPREAWKAANPCPQPDSRPGEMKSQGRHESLPAAVPRHATQWGRTSGGHGDGDRMRAGHGWQPRGRGWEPGRPRRVQVGAGHLTAREATAGGQRELREGAVARAPSDLGPAAAHPVWEGGGSVPVSSAPSPQTHLPAQVRNCLLMLTTAQISN